MSKFIMLENTNEVKDVMEQYKHYTSILLHRPVQSGKTSDVLKVASHYYKTSALVFISDKNTSLAGQTNDRAKVLGFDVVNYRDDIKLGKFLKESIGKKRILHLLMEIHNLEMLEGLLFMLEDLPVTIVIDEADKSRNTIDAKKKESEDSEDDEDTTSVDGSALPPVTMLLLKIKNHIKARENSRVVFVSATPMGVLAAEKDDWLVLYKKPYNNYIGIGIDHPAQLHVSTHIQMNRCKARDRWTENELDVRYNTFYTSVGFAVDKFSQAPNRSGESITQLCLISLENRKLQQFKMSQVIRKQLSEMGLSDTVSVIVFNSDTKESNETTLASLIGEEKSKGFKKVIIIAGFMASRGVSFTEFSDKDNMFELIMQVHYTKINFPLNSSLQNMRIFGPARRTVNTPALICNDVCAEDVKVNFIESFRIIRQIAESGSAKQGSYDSRRPLTQPYNFRYLKQGWLPERFVYPSPNEEDHLPIE